MNIPKLLTILSFVVLSIYILFKFIPNNEFRLHVISNSNNIEDSIIKLKVSTKIENYLKEKTINTTNKSELYAILKLNHDEILDICNTTLKDNNSNYTAKLDIGKINYDKKDNIYYSMNKGVYDSIKITLGNGKGNNFFNVLFPNKTNLDKLKPLEPILPGISSISEETDIEYSFKYTNIFDSIKNLFK